MAPKLTFFTNFSKPQPQSPNDPSDSDIIRLPETVSSLPGPRLSLHSTILDLIKENNLDQAASLICNHFFTPSRATIFTTNAVLTEFFRRSRYSDLLSLHRFITEGGGISNIITQNIVLQSHFDCRDPKSALELFKNLLIDSRIDPSHTDFRIFIKGLTDYGLHSRQVQRRYTNNYKFFTPDPVVRISDADGIFKLYEDLEKEKKKQLGGVGVVEDAIVFGSLMHAYFLKRKENEAMEFYQEVLKKTDLDHRAYTSVLDAISKNYRVNEALILHHKMIKEHC